MRRGAARFAVILVAGAGCGDLVGAHFDDPTFTPPAGFTCSVADASSASVRLGDLVPSADRYDFCLTRMGGSSPIDGVPAVASQAGGSLDGLGYEQVFAPIVVPAGAYDVQLQPAGQGCSGAPVVEASVCAGGPVTLLLLGDGTTPPSLDAFPESAAPAGAAGLRFIHAVSNGTNLDFGYADQPQLPTSVTPVFTDVAFGTTGSSAAGSSDANGYVVAPSRPTPTGLATAPAGTGARPEAASQLTPEQLSPGHGYTAFAAGSTTDPRFPQELYVCDETQTEGPLTSCGGVPSAITVDSVNAFLFGPFSVHPSARTQPVIDAIANLTSDVVCVSSLMNDQDKVSLTAAAAASGQFPYSQWYADTLDTPVDDPADQNGNTPPPFSTPGCPDTTSQMQLSALLGCLTEQCSTKPGDDTGAIIEDPVTCILTQCTSAAETVIGASPFCWGCALVEMQSEVTFRDIQTMCTTDPAAGRLLLNGQSGIVLLSHLPIMSPWQYVLPATGTRAGLVGATVGLPNTPVDVVCAQTTDPGDGVIVPYTGQYGNGLGTGAAAWQQELLLQVGKVVAHTRTLAAATGRRTVLAGQWNTGPTVPGVLAANNPDSFALLSAALAQAVPFGYAPACTSCAANPLVTQPGTQSTAQDTWGTYAVLGRIPVTDVASASVILQTPIIPYEGYLIPVSPNYGFRTTVRVRP